MPALLSILQFCTAGDVGTLSIYDILYITSNSVEGENLFQWLCSLTSRLPLNLYQMEVIEHLRIVVVELEDKNYAQR